MVPCLSTGDGGVAIDPDRQRSDRAVGEWHHVAAVMDRVAGTLRVLVDGVQQAGVTNLRETRRADETIPCLSGHRLRGRHQPRHPGRQHGRNPGCRTLPAATRTLPRPCWRDQVGDEAGLVAYIKADEGSGDTAADATGNGSQVSLSNSTTPVVLGAIEHLGQANRYTFCLTEPNTRLYFDAMTDSSSTSEPHRASRHAGQRTPLPADRLARRFVAAGSAGRGLHPDHRRLYRFHRRIQFPPARSVRRHGVDTGYAGRRQVDAGQQDGRPPVAGKRRANGSIQLPE